MAARKLEMEIATVRSIITNNQPQAGSKQLSQPIHWPSIFSYFAEHPLVAPMPDNAKTDDAPVKALVLSFEAVQIWLEKFQVMCQPASTNNEAVIILLTDLMERISDAAKDANQRSLREEQLLAENIKLPKTHNVNASVPSNAPASITKQEEKEVEFFNGLGYSSEVPIFLRFVHFHHHLLILCRIKGRIRNRFLSKRNTSLLVHDIWREKSLYDIGNSAPIQASTSIFSFDWLNRWCVRSGTG